MIASAGKDRHFYLPVLEIDTWRHYAKWKKPVSLHSHKMSTIDRSTEAKSRLLMNECQGEWENRVVTYMHRVSFQDGEYVLNCMWYNVLRTV